MAGLFFWELQMSIAPVIITTGSIISFGAASASVALPLVSGAPPFGVRLAATGACYVQFGTSGVTAVAGGALIQPADAVVLDIPRGITHIAAIQVSAGGVLQISPIENA